MAGIVLFLGERTRSAAMLPDRMQQYVATTFDERRPLFSWSVYAIRPELGEDRTGCRC
jgi:hypothetical protein